jgi:hypothetical protein
MATIGNTALTLLDWSKRHVGTNIPMIAELLNQSNEILTDMLWIEGNQPTGNIDVVRTGLPTPVWRKLYGGVPPSKSITLQVMDSCGMLEARSEPDKKLCDLNGNTAQFRLSESIAFLEAMNQTFITALFAGDTTLNPEQIMGFQPRYNSLSGATAQSVISAGGSGSDNASVYLVAWGENTIRGIFPKGSMAGLSHQDLGEGDAFESTNRYRAYMDRYTWDCGLGVKDWRYVVRICNIDISDLQGQATTQTLTVATNILNCMNRARYRLPNLTLGRPVFYCNRTVRAGLDWMALNKSNAALSIREAMGQFETAFMGIPIRNVDALGIAETAVA